MNPAPRPRKRLSQNFLASAAYLHRIVSAVGITAEDVVLEIGPGTGNLTRWLLEKARLVLAIEIDPRLVGHLRERFGPHQRLHLSQGDALKIDYPALAAEFLPPGGHFKLAANLPYHAGTAILQALIPVRQIFSSLIVMLQREVGERLTAQPGSKAFGVLSLKIQYYFQPRILFIVPPAAFRPKPTVDSCVVQLIPRESPAVEVADEGLFWRLIETAFSHRRKTLIAALRFSPEFGDKLESIAQALKTLGLRENVRGEALGLEGFAALSNILTTCL